jgi:hypothetical protein
MQDLVTLPGWFLKNGYYTTGMGKVRSGRDQNGRVPLVSFLRPQSLWLTIAFLLCRSSTKVSPPAIRYGRYCK